MTVVRALRNLTCLFAMSFFINSAAAQVLIPHGDCENDFEKYLVAIIARPFFVLRCGATTKVIDRFCRAEIRVMTSAA